MPLEALLVFVGGGFGAVSRWLVGKLALRLAGQEFPWGTLAINLLGSLLIGLVVGAAERGVLNPRLRLLLAAGFLGGFTTFSTFALGSFELFRTGRWGTGLAQLLAANLGGIVLAALGWALGARR